MKKILSIRLTSPGSPEQYEGELESGEKFYIRIRYGISRIDVNGETMYEGVSEDEMKGAFDKGEVETLLFMADIDPHDFKSKLVDVCKERMEKLLEDVKRRMCEDEEKGNKPEVSIAPGCELNPDGKFEGGEFCMVTLDDEVKHPDDIERMKNAADQKRLAFKGYNEVQS